MEQSPIVKEPHKVLREKAHEVPLKSITSPEIQGLIRHMRDVLRVTPDGVGLAAPQVGRSLQIFIASEEGEAIDEQEAAHKKSPEVNIGERPERPEKREWKYYVFINPKALNISRKKIDRAEGCLSVPGVFGSVKRHEKITVEAYDEHGKKFTRGASRFFARILQHELDHLEGTLFIDKADKKFTAEPHGKPDGG